MNEKLKLIDGEIIPIYEDNKGERLVDARQLHKKLENKRKFTDWIKQRIEHYQFVENQDFITFHNFVKHDQNDNLRSKTNEYYLTIDMAKELNGEIISADSRLVYKGFDIATAKPTMEEREGIPHHLIDVVER